MISLMFMAAKCVAITRMASSQLCDDRTPPHVALRHIAPMRSPAPDTPGFRLREARRGKKWSQSDLAEIMGFSRAHITHMELNTYRGGRASWEAAAKALGVSIDYLLQGANRGGLAEDGATAPAPPALPPEDADALLGELAQQLAEMLRAAGMPADARTVMHMTLEAWRDYEVLPRSMPQPDRVELVLSERRSMIEHARNSLFHRRR